MMHRWRTWTQEVVAYWRDCVTPLDFGRLMRARLSLSKVGPLLGRQPTTVDVRMRSFGGPITLRTHSTDVSVLLELLIAKTYAPAVAAAPLDAATVLDLGANTGLAARWIAHRLRGARVVCVEPDPGNVAMLRRNLAPLGDRAHVIAACVGGWRRDVALVTSNGSFAFRMTDDAAGQRFPVITLEDVRESSGARRIDLLKCDIEGAEAELFADCAEWIRDVHSMVVECHAPYTAGSLLESLGAAGVSVDITDMISTPEFGCEVVTCRLQG